jgi:predicted nucleic acid-binding protein
MLDGSRKDLEYADNVLKALKSGSAAVPSIWGLEVANVLVRAERHRSIDRGVTEDFILTLARLKIVADDKTYEYSLADTFQLSREYTLTAYDASYLELALRLNVPLATLDEKLIKATRKAGVKRFA